MSTHVSRTFHAVLFLIFLIMCGSLYYSVKASPGLPSEPAPTPAPLVSDTSIPDTDWARVSSGLERRVIQIYDEGNQRVESLYIWRLDQKYFRLDVAYDERAKSLQDWQEETDATIVVNGGYFSIANEKYFPDGLTIVDGRATGKSFNGFGGMLAIDRSGAELRWLAQRPYDPSESLQAALQAFPILVEPGGSLGFGAERENFARARRTVIGQDQQGRILLIVAPQGHFTLHELSAYLTRSDLGLDIAVNLDGGGSTGILVVDPPEIIPPRVLLPFVILVHSR